MTCGNCGRDNPPANAYCHGCGARLRRSQPALVEFQRCPSCQRDNPPGMRFCSECGAALGSASESTDNEGSGGALMCPRCGQSARPSQRYCNHCGWMLDEQPRQQVVSGPSLPDMPAADQPGAQVVIIRRDGSDGGAYPLQGDYTDLGSREGAIVLSDDPFLSHRHARIELRGGTFVLRDLGSLNGIYVRIREPAALQDGDMILIGQQVLRFEMLSDAERQMGAAMQRGVMVFGTPQVPRAARLVQYTTEGVERDVYHLYRDETVVGREQADIVFPDDPYMSRRHAMVCLSKDRRDVTLSDLGSSNGTSLRCRSEHPLRHGDQFRAGRHLFRFDILKQRGSER